MNWSEKRVLLIDDEEELRDLFRLSMGKIFTVDSAADGVDGLAKIESFRPQVIVLDLMMPRLDGFGVIRKLQDTEFRWTPIIVITGFSDAANEALISSERNVSAVLSKPIKFEELAAKVKELLAAQG